MGFRLIAHNCFSNRYSLIGRYTKVVFLIVSIKQRRPCQTLLIIIRSNRPIGTVSKTCLLVHVVAQNQWKFTVEEPRPKSCMSLAYISCFELTLILPTKC